MPRSRSEYAKNKLGTFWRFVIIYEDGCWTWDGQLKDGYGKYSHKGKTYAAHRWAYQQLVGPIPTGLQLDHLCRNPPCVRPDHLEPVTSRENVLRGQLHTCPHPRTPQNGYIKQKDGRWVCRECRKTRMRRWRANKTPSPPTQ